MIPNIRNGSSFRGAGAYYLHDKHAATNHRVAWTRALNCAHDEPEAALDEMWQTASMQDYLRQASGHAVSGRKAKTVVKTISLSWHPNDTPSRKDMEAAGIAYLERMGWGEHQALLLAHTDTKHPHIHIVLNRVHPETGLVLDDYKDQKRAQSWALDYAKEHNLVRWQERVKADNDNARQLPENVIALPVPQPPVAADHDANLLRAHERQTLLDAQRAERIAFFQDGKALFREARQEAFQEVREAYKERWQEHFAAKQALEAEAEQASGGVFSRGLYFLRRGDVGAAARGLFDQDAAREAAAADIEAQRLTLTDRQREETRVAQDLACDQLREERGALYDQVKIRQREERAELRLAHASGERASWVYEHPVFSRAANQNERIEPDDRDVSLTEPAAAIATPPAAVRDQNVVEFERPGLPAAEHERPSHKLPTDAAAGSIGAAAEYLADQIAEFVAPTPPEVREANAKEQAAAKEKQAVAREAEKANPFAKFADAAARQAEAEREEARSRSYWEHRERSRDR